jgi:cytochrome P450
MRTGTNGVSAVFTLAFYHLISNPQILTKLITELREAYPSHDGMDALQLDTLSDLPYLSAVADESMRLGATFGSFPRVAPAGGAVLASRFVPEGTIVSVPVWAQNMSEKNFCPHPERFLPERWLPGGLGPGSYINRNAMMSFSHGVLSRRRRRSRMC